MLKISINAFLAPKVFKFRLSIVLQLLLSWYVSYDRLSFPYTINNALKYMYF